MSSGGITGHHDQSNTGAPAIVVGRKGSHGSLWWTDEAAFVIDTAYSIDATTTRADLRWLYYALSTLGLGDLSNDVGIPGLSRSAAYEAHLPVAPAEEQRRVADFLDDRVPRIDRIIAARRSEAAALEEAATAHLSDLAFSGRELVPLRYLIEDERLGLWGSEIGEHREEVHVARVADFERQDFRLGDVTTVRSAPWSHIHPRLLRHGDVLLERSGGTQINPVGCPAFVDSPSAKTVCSNFVSRLRPRQDVDGRYLSLMLGALYATRQQAPHSTQTTGIMNLNSASYFRVRVPRRSTGEQLSLASQMDESLQVARSRGRELTQSVRLLKEYKTSLITAAVSGELDITTAGSTIPG